MFYFLVWDCWHLNVRFGRVQNQIAALVSRSVLHDVRRDRDDHDPVATARHFRR